MFRKYLYDVKTSFWYVPSLYGVIAIILALLSLKVDAYIMTNDTWVKNIPNIFISDISLARTILSSISGSLLTMTTITFSTILVVLTTFLSEYSPRTLQNFITNKNTQRVLGIFVGGFVYSVLLLLFLREEHSDLFIVPSFAVVFAIVCLTFFVFFIHHVSTWMQVSNLIFDITFTTIKRIDNILEDKEKVHEDAPWEDWESEEIKYKNPKKVYVSTPGYIRHFDINGLIDQAKMDDSIVKIEKKVSEYVDQDTPTLLIWRLEDHNIGDYEQYISIGKQNSPVNDLEFGLTKLVEIALRALSSGINDPNTAISCIDNLGKVLTKLGKKHLPKSYHNDAQRNLRVIYPKPSYADYLYQCFYQIRAVGFSDVSVLLAGLRALTLIAENNDESIKGDVWQFTKYIIEGMDVANFLSLDRDNINYHLEKLAVAANRSREFKRV